MPAYGETGRAALDRKSEISFAPVVLPPGSQKTLYHEIDVNTFTDSDSALYDAVYAELIITFTPVSMRFNDGTSLSLPYPEVHIQ